VGERGIRVGKREIGKELVPTKFRITHAIINRDDTFSDYARLGRMGNTRGLPRQKRDKSVEPQEGNKQSRASYLPVDVRVRMQLCGAAADPDTLESTP
jgi:hypothetical protein